LKLFTVLPLDEIDRLAALKGAEINEAKKVLATEATALVHGRTAAEEAAGTARTTFEEGGLGATLPTLPVKNDESVVNVVTRIGFSSSNAQARQFVRDGAVYLGNVKITDISTKIAPQYFGPDGRSLLQVGKKRGIATLKSE
jgi:tyrosyl-tRNA synthetase